MPLLIRRRFRKTFLVPALAAALLASGCTANTSALDERGLLPHLTVDLQLSQSLPEQTPAGSLAQFRATVEQNGSPAQVDRVTFQIWPEDRPEQRIETTGVLRDGFYVAEHRLDAEGIYIVRCLVQAGALEAMPAKRFALGQDAVLRLAELERQQSAQASAPAAGDGGGHHH